MTQPEMKSVVLDLDDEFKEEWSIRSAFWLEGMKVSEAYVNLPPLGCLSGDGDKETQGVITVDHVIATQREALSIAAAHYKSVLGNYATGRSLIRSAMSLQLMVDLAFNTSTYPHLPPELIVTPYLRHLLVG